MEVHTNIENSSSLEEHKKKAISTLLQNNILLNPKSINRINSLKTKKKILKYINEILLSKNKDYIKTTTQKNTGNFTEKKNIEVVENYQEHNKKREVSDFFMHYNNRFKILSSILKEKNIDNLTSIGVIKNLKERQKIATIGMVFNINETKKGNIALTLEDKTGMIKAIILRSDIELFNLAKDIMYDEVIAVKGYGGDSVIFVSDIILPDIPEKEIKKYSEEEYAVFIGDLHIGAKDFYNQDFLDFIAWISGEKTPDRYKEIISKIKYLFICGDLIEGVGIFPGQEKELDYKSVEEQYNLVAGYLSNIPDRISIIACPGNHDAVRIAEPQPAFNKKYIGRLKDLKNLYLISSPGVVNIGKTDSFDGFNVLLYHGFSMPYYGDKVKSIRENGGLHNMTAIMKYYLQRRHLAPSHGSTQFIPDIRYDPLVIDKVPDFFLTGHVHKVSVDNYKSVTMINASTWVAPNEYQSRFGLIPDCSRAVLINLKTRGASILNFEKQKRKLDKKENE